MYHNICDDPESGVPAYYRTNTSPAVFRQHMQFLADNGYKTISIHQLVTKLLSSASQLSTLNSQPLVALTFDDAFRSVYTEAFPVLQEHGFTASVFLPTAFIGDTRRQFRPSTVNLQLTTALDCLTWSEVLELRRHGFEFGSHTVNHPELVKLAWADIQSEISNSKSEIERHLGQAVTSFCYPFAFPQADRAFTQTLRGVLVETGYTSCLTTQIGCVQPGDDPFCIKRLPANSLDDECLFLAKLDGAYDWLARPQRTAKRLASVLKPRR